MEFTDVLAGRYTTRAFTDAAVTDEQLRRVLGAGLAMPHAGNTYDWRVIVLRREQRHPRWAAIHAAMLNQDYLAEAPVVAVFVVQPQWWAARYKGNVETLLGSRILAAERHGDLLAHLNAGIGVEKLTTLLVGEAMMAVGASVLAAVDLGLGAGLTVCHPEDLHAALELPDDVVVCQTGILALGHPADAERKRAPKPDIADMVHSGGWDRTLVG